MLYICIYILHLIHYTLDIIFYIKVFVYRYIYIYVISHDKCYIYICIYILHLIHYTLDIIFYINVYDEGWFAF